jgi:hypothetical protein
MAPPRAWPRRDGSCESRDLRRSSPTRSRGVRRQTSHEHQPRAGFGPPLCTQSVVGPGTTTRLLFAASCLSSARGRPVVASTAGILSWRSRSGRLTTPPQDPYAHLTRQRTAVRSSCRRHSAAFSAWRTAEPRDRTPVSPGEVVSGASCDRRFARTQPGILPCWASSPEPVRSVTY